MIRTYKYKLRPSKKFIAETERWLAFCCDLYNAALQERIGAYKVGVTVTHNEQQRQLTEIRAEDKEVRSFQRDATGDALRRLDRAFRAFFRRVRERKGKAGFPRFRSRARYDSISFPKDGEGFWVNGDRVKFSKLGSTRIRLHRPIPGTIKTATIKRQVDGWFVTFSCDVPQPAALPVTMERVGVDVGIEHFATLSNGEHVANPRFLQSASRGLKSAHRKVSRSKRGSKRRAIAVRGLALRYLRVARQRQNFAHGVVNSLLARFGLVAVEKLSIRGMVKNRNLAAAIHDAAWSAFIDILTYKAENAGREVVKVNPAYTSRVCSGCGLVQKLELSQRQFICDCGLNLHRDHNAAINILASTSPAWRAAQRGVMRRVVMRADGSISAMKPSDLKEVADRDTRIRELEAEVERMKSVVEAAVEWRRVGYKRRDEFSYRIGPLLDAIDIYDVGHKRPCEEL